MGLRAVCRTKGITTDAVGECDGPALALELDALGSDHELPGPHAGRGHGGGVHRLG